MDISKIDFREMKADEFDRLIELWQKAGLSYRPEGRDSKKRISKELKNPQETFLFAEYENSIIGSILVSHDGRKGWINRLAVIPDYRGLGIAKELIKQAETFLRANDILVFACLIEAWNTSSMQLFQKAGYTKHEDIIYFTKKKNPRV